MTTYTTIDGARQALDTAALDCAADFGEEAVEQAWRDLVHAIAADCSPEVSRELLYRNGFGEGFER